MATKEKYSEIKYYQKGKFSIFLYKNFLPDNLSRSKILLIYHNNIPIILKGGDITNFIFLNEDTIEVEQKIDEDTEKYFHIYCDETRGTIFIDAIKEIDSEIIEFYTTQFHHKYFAVCDTIEEFTYYKKIDTLEKILEFTEGITARA